MTTTITDGHTTVTPTLVMGWESSQDTRNIVHPIIGRSNPDFTIKPSNLRTGTLNLFFEDYAEADLCRSIHANAAVFTLYTDDFAAANMNYVVYQDVTIALDQETLKHWTVTIQFQEVA